MRALLHMVTNKQLLCMLRPRILFLLKMDAATGASNYLRPSYYNGGAGFQYISNASVSPYPPVMPPMPGITAGHHDPYHPWTPARMMVLSPEGSSSQTFQVSVLYNLN